MVMMTDFSEGPLPNPLGCNPPPRPKTPPPPPEPEPEPEPVPKGPYRANAARLEFQPKKNTGDAAKAAQAAKALNGTGRGGNLKANPSYLTLSAFPVPGQAMDPSVVPVITDEEEVDDAATIVSSIMPGSRSVAQLTNFNEYGKVGSTAPSLKSGGSGGKHDKLIGSLGEGVGFTFKATCNFVHPNRQLPRTATRSRQPSMASSVNFDNQDEADLVERMNSVTSDGGWKSGWSVAGSQNGSFSGPSPSAEGRFDWDNNDDDDLAPEEAPATIYEEQEEDDLSPSRSMSPVRIGTNDSNNSSRSARSLKSRKSSLSMRMRANRDDPDTANTSAPTSPIRTSFDRALSMLGKSYEPEDPMSRAANIAAARRAFEEKEAAKDKRWAEYEAKKEERRRRSEARRPSNAVDSASESFEEKLMAAGFGTAFSNTQFINRFEEEEDNDSCDPFSPGPEQQYTTAQDTLFPAYEENEESDEYYVPRNKSVHRDVPMYQEYDFSQFQEQSQEETGLFPPLRTAMEQEEDKGLFPPPLQPVHQAQYYVIDGQTYDEYGELVEMPQEQADDMMGYSDASGRRLSKTKQAKGQINKFSAWGKTRMLRV
ncbi:hypothetical protein K461DRAFT_293422 [Myriangium duriaei CBS 260.36]|uniref:Uncharacterized protein n=1 Tax=Myriangium duriaei CBS 260.36 TaxID=1168546 RepID=A0A9P4J467_9PEZI|nr:hypothetical protein K461DRAFT_293422 [Myriangium duriaei CBS 260.36]